MRSRLRFWATASASVLSTMNFAMAGIGSVYLDLTSMGEDGPIITVASTGSVPIEVSFSATPSGTAGMNRGLGHISFRLETDLPLVDQISMVLSPEFVNPANANPVSSTVGAGFDLFTGAGAPIDTDDPKDGYRDAVDAVAGSQDIAEPVFRMSNGDPGPKLEFAGIFAPIQIAKSSVQIAPGTPAGTYLLRVVPTSAFFWDHTPGGSFTYSVTVEELSVGVDTLTLIVQEGDPEPMALADVNLDGDVDGIDFATFAQCYNKAGNPPKSSAGCSSEMGDRMDFDDDGDVDSLDFSVFASCYNKSGNPPRKLGCPFYGDPP